MRRISFLIAILLSILLSSNCFGVSLGPMDTPPSTSATKVRNVVIIGSGPAGCTAGIYAGRALLNPLVIAGSIPGGQLMLTSDVENFPGYDKAVPGPQLMNDLTEQAKRFGAEFLNNDCKSIVTSCWPFKVQTDSEEILAKTVIIATGASAKWTNADNENMYRGKGISSCATCDGYLFRNKDVIVLGGGDSAMEEATFLTRFAKSVTIIHRSESFRASKTMLARAINNSKIKMLTNRFVKSWFGKENGLLGGAKLENSKDKSISEISCDGAFVAIGHNPNTQFLGSEIGCDDKGYIKTFDGTTKTSVDGIFACGDVVDHRYRQAITAAGSGCQAAIDAERWLENEPNR